MTGIIRAGALVLIVTVAMPAPAASDPVTITSGHVATGVLIGPVRVLLNGAGFTLDAFTETFNSTLSERCLPCAPGLTLDLGGSFDNPRGWGSAVVDGIVYPEVFLDGLTATFASPSFQLVGTEALTISLPFIFSGVIHGYTVDPWVTSSEPAFTKTLVGRGMATGTFLYNDHDVPLFFASTLRYDFTDAAPVPEPATLLLFGTGATVLAIRRRLSRRTRGA